jgi:predicted MFS family arabinose efflux permease
MFRAASRRWAEVARVVWTQPFRTFLIASSADDLGNWMFRTTTAWLVWDMTRSPALLGMITIAMLGPSALFGLFGGVLADRFDRATVIRVMHGFCGATLATMGVLHALGWLGVVDVFVILVVRGIAHALANSSRKAILFQLVAPADIGTAITLNSVLGNLAMFVAPPIAAAAIALVGPSLALILASFLVVIYVWAIPALGDEDDEKPPAGGYLADLTDGIVYCWKNPLLRVLFTLHLMGAALARPFMDFIPGIAEQIFSRGIDAVAYITSSIGIGAVIGGLWLAQRRPREGLPIVAIAGASIQCVAMITLVWIPILPIGLVLTTIIGAVMTTRAAAVQTITQLTVESSMRGRSMSVYVTTMHAGIVIGGLGTGLVAEAIGFRYALMIAACLSLAIIILIRSAVMTHAHAALRDKGR